MTAGHHRATAAAAVDAVASEKYKSNARSYYANGYAYCPWCGKFYPRDKVPKSKRGTPLCPYHRFALRMTPLSKKRWSP